MDALKAAFESQFGTEWSVPVNKTSEDIESGQEEIKENSDQNISEEESTSSHDEVDSADDEVDEGPITVKHNEEHINLQPMVASSQRKKFMSSAAPKDDSLITNSKPQTKEDNEDLQNDLALQRLIEESHILSQRPKGQEFTGADISGAGDPLEHIGSSRLKVMEARLAKAGAKTRTQRMPQAMAVGIRDKAKERKDKYRSEAREAGIVIAKERHTKSKNCFRDKGLKINTVGRASEHGIHISPAEIAKVTGSNKKAKRPRKRRS